MQRRYRNSKERKSRIQRGLETEVVRPAGVGGTDLEMTESPRSAAAPSVAALCSPSTVGFPPAWCVHGELRVQTDAPVPWLVKCLK